MLFSIKEKQTISFLFSHIISGEDSCLNEILSRCQVKKALNLETNMSVAYGADRQITSLKRNINTVSAESDIKQTASN